MDNLDKRDKRKDFLKSLKNDKKRLTMIIIAALGVLLIILSLPSGKGTVGTDFNSLAEYKQNLESELSELCSSVSGAGRCRVTVTFSEGERTEYRGTNKISETPPKVLGITVIAEGADKAEVRAALTECMSAMFNIGANRVAVLKMES